MNFKLMVYLIIFIISAIFLFNNSFAIEKGISKTIRVANSAVSGAMGPLWVTKDANLFSKYGINAQVIYIASGAKTTQAMIAGDVNFSRLGATAIINANLAGADTVMIANTINTLVFSLMSKPEMTKILDLKGRRIGISRLGGSTEFGLKIALSKGSLDIVKDVKVFQAGGIPEILMAMKAGALDAGVISPPSNLIGKKLGFREVVDLGTLGIEYPNSPVATTRNFIKENEDIAMNFIRAYSEGIYIFNTNREFSIKVLKKYTKSDDMEILEGVYYIYGVKYLQKIPLVTIKGVKMVLDEIAVSIPKAKLANPQEFFDNSFVLRLEESGFYRTLYRN